MSDIPKRSYPITVLGRTLSFQGPSQISDVERVTKKNAVIEGFMQQYCYHDRGPALKELFARKLEDFLDGKDAQAKEPDNDKDGNQKKDDKGNPKFKYTESEKKFFNRVVAAELITSTDIDRLLSEANDELGEWKPGDVRVAKPSKEFYELADETLRRINDPATGEANKAKFEANIATKLHVDFSEAFGDLNRDNIARAWKALDEAKREEARREAQALFDEDNGGDDDSGE